MWSLCSNRLKKMRSQPPPPTPLARRLAVQRERFLDLKRRSIVYANSRSEDDDGRRREEPVPPPCHLRLELPIEVQAFLTSMGLTFDALMSPEDLSRAVSALAVRAYETDRVLNETVLALCRDDIDIATGRRS
ncbi:Aste57867_11648 [Aphanomyces stellatus]|uniref:Aste57867_11648 protein n=1 Tax=Aphanomyces stellatus TaxID=120398 RepID=A0A485KTU1_9STRA|nr:hypothetical protein As57867_011605 [Aphanomyces stellatus]VFT88506.1 Aste57867_11648 [Aphanomyces stellatus]